MNKIFLLLISIVFHIESAYSQVYDFEILKKLNDAEKRLLEYKDDEEVLKLKIEMLKIINDSRKKYGAKPLNLDIFACRAANKTAKEAALGEYVGHWNLRGEKPYHRWSFWGGLDHIAENAAAEWTTGKFKISSSTLIEKMKNAHKYFMNEKPPNDGHKQTTIDKNHNYVGIGAYLNEKQFRYYELYIDRYLEFSSYKKEAKIGESAYISARALNPNFSIYAVIVYYEPYPVDMTKEKLNSMGAYDDFTDETVLKIWPWELKRIENRYVEFFIKGSKKGLYYVNIFVTDKDFEENIATTEGKIQASGLVIEFK